MKFIKGITFAPFSHRGVFSDKKTYSSLDDLISGTGADMIILVPGAVQDNPQSEKIDYTSAATMSDDELKKIISYIQSKGLRTCLKPTVNCRNGTWRAHISFFDEDVPCEPKWSNWFESYTDFQCHYAGMASETGCELFIAGCEMVQTEHRETEWRNTISQIRNEYKGLVSYNTDKYQEHNVKWWDAVDVISSSGYYPLNDWGNQLDRIEKVVMKYDKPFFFAECGCMSVKGSDMVPNDWSIKGDADPQGQANWYSTMFGACSKRAWIGGFAVWDWSCRFYPAEKALEHKGYDIFAKPAQEVIRDFYMSR